MLSKIHIQLLFGLGIHYKLTYLLVYQKEY